MSVTVKLVGLEDFRRALRNLPQELVEESSHIVVTAAENAKRQLQSVYPQGPTGNLRSKIVVRTVPSRLTAQARLLSQAPHAHLYEFGTRNRRTDKGWRRGRMPKAAASDAAIPVFIQARRRMVQALIGVVQRAGFLVQAS